MKHIFWFEDRETHAEAKFWCRTVDIVYDDDRGSKEYPPFPLMIVGDANIVLTKMRWHDHTVPAPRFHPAWMRFE